LWCGAATPEVSKLLRAFILISLSLRLGLIALKYWRRKRRVGEVTNFKKFLWFGSCEMQPNI